MKKVVFALLAVISVGLSAAVLCGCEKINEYTFSEAEPIVLTPPGMTATDLPYELYPVFYGNDYADFYIDSYISESDRNRAVTFTMQALDYIKPEHKITCYVSRYLGTMQTYDPYVIYLSERDIKSFDHLMNVVTAATGGKVPYGLSYALARRINNEYKWGLSMPKGTKSGVRSYLNSDPRNADLQAPDFYKQTNSKYKKARKAALSFADYIEQSEDLLSAVKTYDYQKYEAYKRSWTQSLGVQCEDGLNAVFSFIGGNAREIVIRAQNINLYIPVDHVDSYSAYYMTTYGISAFRYSKTYKGLKKYLAAVLNAIDSSTPELDLYLDDKDALDLHFGQTDIVDGNGGYASTMFNVYALYLYHRFSITAFTRVNRYVDAMDCYFNYKYCYTDMLAESELLGAGMQLQPAANERVNLVKSKYPELSSYLDDFESYRRYSVLYAHADAYLTKPADNRYQDGYYNDFYSRSYILYIADKYGIGSFDRLRKGENYLSVFGTSESALTASWLNYVTSLFLPAE